MQFIEFLNSLIFGIIFYLATQSLFLFLFNKKEKYHFSFSMLMFSFALLTLYYTGLHDTLFSLSSHSFFPYAKRLFIIIAPALGTFFLPRYVLELAKYPGKTRYLYVCALFQFLLCLFADVYYQIYGEIYIIESIIWFFTVCNPIAVFIVTCYKIIRSEKTSASVLIIPLAAVGLNFLYIAFKALIYMNNIAWPFQDYSIILVGATTLLIASTLAVRIRNDQKALIKLKDSLEDKVVERTSELQEALEKIKIEKEHKNNFFINIAHETKTPLTLILHYLDEYIKEKKMDKKLEIIKHNIHKLNRDMNNFLDIEKLELGKHIYDHTQVISISTILEDALILFKGTASEKNITITGHIEKQLYINCDPSAAERIVYNLLDNALKYTDSNGTIHVSLEKEDQKVVLTVQDTGIGIKNEVLNAIFTPYFQINAKKENSQGLGMGLAIIHKLVTELEGFVSVDSTEGKGSVFKVGLLAAVPPDNVTLEDENNSDKDFCFSHYAGYTIPEGVPELPGKPYILFVEDNPDLLYYLWSSFKDKYNCLTAKNGKEALEKLYSSPPVHLIVSDIMMDQIDGYDFLNIIKSKSNFQEITIIFLTAMTTQYDKLTGLKSGVIDYITKPFSIEELSFKIDTHILHYQNQIDSIKSKMISFLTAGESVKSKKERLMFELQRKYRFYGLSDKEIQIVNLLMAKHEHKQIADILDLSINTVNYHLKNIYAKAGVKNRSELIINLTLDDVYSIEP